MSVSLATLKTLGVSDEISTRWLVELQAPHRHYHTLSHIASILQSLNELGNSDPSMIAAAWLHDIRYDATRTDNEEVSAEIAREDLRGTKVDIEEVVAIIIDTKLHAGGAPKLDLFNDIDLSILGSNTIHYDWYSKAIRREYAHVPLDVYANARAGVLEKFNEGVIFRTPDFAACEAKAHYNLQHEIKRLRETPEYFEV